jgi:hypothetical protein
LVFDCPISEAIKKQQTMKFSGSIIIFMAALFSAFTVSAQTPTQTVRGVVVDKISQAPLYGATVIVLNTSPIIGAVSNEDGKFTLSNVPVGQQSIRITYMGYKEAVMQNLTVNAGKELVITVNLEEDAKALEEVVITQKKNKTLNSMSTVSTRQFSVEETRKYAAAVNDPARMATSFAGVVQAGDGNNNISIRGNSPNGLLWRMEGVEIPNPNHFSNVGSSGGGISIISSQLLSNSDFSTGAFAAEYGNALSGVFDLRLRKGNNQKREYTIQAGFLGMDVAAEGPFKKGYDGSFLINYRYSTLSLLGKIGVPLGDEITNFQDLSFNVYLPTKKLGNFTVFGFGGLSTQTSEAKKDSALWEEDDYYRLNTKFYSNTGAMGITNTKNFKNKSYLKTSLVYSGTQNGDKEESLQNDYNTFVKEHDEKYTQTKLTLSSVYTKKLNAKSNIRTGIILNRLGYNLTLKSKTDTTALTEKLNVNGSTETVQGFFQLNHKVNTRLTTNIGVHYYQLLLNNSNSLEPRASVKYDVNARSNFILGYGLHSQLQPIGVYFGKSTENGVTNYPNRNLGLSKSHHIVTGYDFNINDHAHIKTELYYQYLFNVPISADKTSVYSILNSMDGYNTDPLTNKGLGKNYGAELTYERFLHKNLYYLLSASMYESKYKAANNNWYNTRFNTNYAVTFTAGKEWTTSKRNKNRIIGFNIKSIYVGGFRHSPIDVPASIASGETKFINSQAFTKKNPDYYRLDLRVSMKRNYKNITTTLALDIQNATNHKNVGGQYFDGSTGKVKYFYQSPLIPILSYRVEF